MQSVKIGQNSVRLGTKVRIMESASVVGKKEGEGPLGVLFDRVEEDPMFGCNTWEEAESALQKEAVELTLQKAGILPEQIDYMYAGDLLGQGMATSFGLKEFQIPHFGIYGACSTCGEALCLGAMSIAGGFAAKVLCVTSSHFASAEKEFRYPLAYGNQRPLSATWTVTGGAAFLLGEATVGQKVCGGGEQGKAPVSVTGFTIGQITDYGVKDSMNMGACMAPAAARTIVSHFRDFGVGPQDYDKIITGDLGQVGQRILWDLMAEKGYDLSRVHTDCGIEIYDSKTQDTHAGGSGCGCCAVTLSAYIMKMLREKVWRKVLFVPTGALLSKTSFNEGKSVPSIAHAVVLEAI